MHTRHQCARRTMLEIWRRQVQQMTEHLTAEYGIDSIACMQDKILSQPRHGTTKQHEHHQPYRYGDECAVNLMDDHLVNDDLSKQGGDQTGNLDHQGSQQHIAPNAPVLHQLRDKPAKAEWRFRSLSTRCIMLLGW